MQPKSDLQLVHFHQALLSASRWNTPEAGMIELEKIDFLTVLPFECVEAAMRREW